MKKKILVISSNPKNTARLRLDEEVREIEDGLSRSKYRDEFIINTKWAVRLRDLRRALLDDEPYIVHFSGHGEVNGLMIEDEQGAAIIVSPEALSGLFEEFTDHVECVLLNACYSEIQAKAIGKHINYVIGMQTGITDKAAIEFAVGFYDAVGAGKSIEEAYKLGCNAIQLFNIPEHLTPTLKNKNTMTDDEPRQRILVCYPFSTPCEDFVEWIQRCVYQNNFEPVKPPLQTRSFKEFREVVQSIDGIIAMCVPFDENKKIASAWVDNFIGAIAAQPDPLIPALAIKVKDIDVAGLAKLDECRCPIEYPWQGTSQEKEKALARMEKYLLMYFEKVREAGILKNTQSNHT